MSDVAFTQHLDPEVHGKPTDRDETEYEYDENETETFFVTIDLSSKAQIERPAKPKGAPRRRAKAPKGPTSEAEGSIKAIPDLSSAVNEDPVEAEAGVTLVRKENEKAQIMDLHSLNPYMSFNDQLYSCKWGTALGTDMLFSAKDSTDGSTLASPAQNKSSSASVPGAFLDPMLSSAASATPNHDLLPGKASLLAMTAVKLTGTPIIAVPRVLKSEVFSKSSEQATPIDPRATSPQIQSQQTQATFLARMAAIKRAKGETDIVPLHVQPKPNPDVQTVSASHGTKKPLGRGRKRVQNTGTKRLIGHDRNGLLDEHDAPDKFSMAVKQIGVLDRVGDDRDNASGEATLQSNDVQMELD